MLAFLSFSLFIFLVHGAISTTTETPSNKGLGGLLGDIPESFANITMEILKKSKGNDSLLDEYHKKLIEKLVDEAIYTATETPSDNQTEALLTFAKKISEKMMGNNSLNDGNKRNFDNRLQPVSQTIYPRLNISVWKPCYNGPRLRDTYEVED